LEVFDVRGLLTRETFARIVDMVQLAPTTTLKMVDALIDDACAYEFHAIGCPYCFHPYVIESLKDRGKIGSVLLLGGGGFPDGNCPVAVKLASVEACLQTGCDEIDVTSNLCYIKSGMFDLYRDELMRIRAVTRGRTLKVIIHAPQLTQDEISTVCDIISEIGADFIKTDTGRSPSPTTLDHILFIKSRIGERVQIKAAGGIRDVGTVQNMYGAGVTRFGVGHSAAMSIFAGLPRAY
jgi:deoxyribose-phosphate aldolase